MAADINVFDPERIAPRIPTVVNDIPTGEKRFAQGADGFVATIIGGEVVLRDGEPTGALPGKVLSGRGSPAT